MGDLGAVSAAPVPTAAGNARARVAHTESPQQACRHVPASLTLASRAAGVPRRGLMKLELCCIAVEGKGEGRECRRVGVSPQGQNWAVPPEAMCCNRVHNLLINCGL
jgi:hypothetical protein